MSQDHTKKEVIDPELEEVRRSMGSRIDPDEPEGVDPKDPNSADPKDPKTPITEEKDPENPEGDKGKEGVDPKEPDPEGDKTPKLPDDKNPTNRPERFIPLSKYHDKEREWETEKAALNDKVKTLSDQIESGTQPQTPKDIAAFAEKHNMTEELVTDLLEVAKSTLLPSEKLEKIDQAVEIASKREKDEQILASQEAFKTEFTDAGVPVLKKLFPDATDTQLEAARVYLDSAAHTETYHKAKLSTVIYETEGELAKIFTSTGDEKDDKTVDTPPGMEHGRHTGRAGIPKAADFAGKDDFADLLALDPQLQEQIRKDFDNPTYEKYMHFMAKQEKEGGITVMRNGRKINLK